MASIALTSTTTTGFVETDFDQIKDLLQDGGVDAIRFSVNQTGSSGIGVELKRDLVSGSTDDVVVMITQDNVGDDMEACKVVQDGTASGLWVERTNADTSAPSIHIRTIQGGNEFASLGLTNSAAGTFEFKRDLTSGNTQGPLVSITNANSGDDQPVLSISQAVTTVEAISFTAGSIAINFATAMASTGANTPSLTNSPSAGSVTWIACEHNGVPGTIPFIFDS